MFDISKNGIIRVTRGDSFNTVLFVNTGTLLEPIRYILQPDDKLYLGVTEPNQPFEHALIRKVFTCDDLDENGDVIIKFKSEDTEYLLPGVYYYQVKLYIPAKENRDEAVNTIVPKLKFIILD